MYCLSGGTAEAVNHGDDRLTQLAQRFSAQRQIVSANESPQEQASGRQATSQVASSQESLPLGVVSGPATPVTDHPVSSDSSWLLQTVTALGVVLGLVMILRRCFSQWMGRPVVAPGSHAVQVLTRVAVAPRNHILLVRLGGRVLVIADSSHGLRTLANLDDPEEVASLLAAVTTSEPNSISRGFASLLQRFNSAYRPNQCISDEGADATEHCVDRTRDQVSSVLSRMRVISQRRAVT